MLWKGFSWHYFLFCFLTIAFSLAFEETVSEDYDDDFPVKDSYELMDDQGIFDSVSVSKEYKLATSGQQIKIFEWVEEIFMIHGSDRETVLSRVIFTNSSIYFEEVGEIATIQNISSLEIASSGPSLITVQGSNTSSILLINTIRSTVNGIKIDDGIGVPLPGKFRDISLLQELDGTIFAALTYVDSSQNTRIIFCKLTDDGMWPYESQEIEGLINGTVELYRDGSTFLISIANGTHCQIVRLDQESGEVTTLGQFNRCSSRWSIIHDGNENFAVEFIPPDLNLYHISDSRLELKASNPFPGTTSFHAVARSRLLLFSQNSIKLISADLENYKEIWKREIPCDYPSLENFMELPGTLVLLFACQTHMHLNFVSFKRDEQGSYEGFEDLDEEIHYLEMQLDVCISDWTEQIKYSEKQINELLSMEEAYRQYKETEVTTWDTISIPPNFETRTSKMSAKIEELWMRLEAIQTNIPNLLSYSGNQTLSGSIYTRQINADSVTIDKGHINTVNFVPLTTYAEDYLRLDVPQEIDGHLSFEVLSAVNATILDLTDDVIGFRPEDLMRYDNQDQIVTGHHIYSSIELTGSSIGRMSESISTINGIPSSEFVHKGPSMNLLGHKELDSQVNFYELKLDTLNNVSYDDWFDEFRLPERRKVFTKPLTVYGDVEVSGNVFASAINGINITDEYQNAVKPFDFTVEGPVEFSQPVEITENFKANRVNGLEWKEILLNTDQEVKSLFHIEKALVSGNLLSSSINGLDFGKDVYSKNDNPSIEGFKTFANDVVVTGSDGIKMEDDAKINGIDPSEDIKFSKEEDTLVIHKSLHSDDLELIGDLQITYMNGEMVPDFEHGFWRKSIAQNINHPVHIESMNIKGDVALEKLNGLKVSNYVTSNSDQILTGTNIFMDTVTIGDLEISEGRTLDGVDLVELEETEVTTDSFQHFEKSSFFEDITIDSLMIADGNLNQLPLSRFFHQENPILEGKVIFKDFVTVKDVHGPRQWKFENFNNHSLEDLIDQKTRHIQTINGSVELGKMEAESLEIEGLVNGIDFEDWASNVVLKKSKHTQIMNGTLTVHGRVTFLDEVDFNEINNVSWSQYSEQILWDDPIISISTYKKFQQPLKVLGNLTVDSVNGINLSKMINRTFLKDKDQIITGQYEFAGSLFTKKAYAETINEVEIDNIVMINEPMQLRGRTYFPQDVWFKNLSASNSWLGGCNLDQAVRLPKFDSQFDFSDHFSVGHIEVRGNVTSTGPVVTRSGKNHIDVVKSLVRKSRNHVVNAPVTFNDLVVANDFRSDIINEVHVDDILSTDNTKDIVLNCALNFTSAVDIKHIIADSLQLNTNSMVNNLEIKKLEEDAISKGTNGLIYGKKSFNGDVTVTDNLQVKNFDDLFTDTLLHRGNKCSDRKIFFERLLIEGPFDDTTPLKRKTIATDIFTNLIDNHFSDPKQKVNFYIKGGLRTKNLNGIKLSDVVKLDSEHQVLKGHKTFHHMTIYGDLRAKKINSIPVNELFDSESSPSRLTESGINTHDSILNSSYLAKLRKYQDYNERLGQHSYLKFENLTLIDHVQSVHSLWTAPSTSGTFFLVQKYDGDCGGRECGCQFVTHTLKVSDNKLGAIESQFGIYVILDTLNTGYLYDFILPCNPRNPLATVRALRLNREVNGSRLLEEDTLMLGIIVKVKYFYANKVSYFLVATVPENDSQSIEEYEVTLYMRSPSEGFKEIKNMGLLVDFDLELIGGEWNLLAVKNVLNEVNYRSEILHYKWKTDLEQFKLVSSHPSELVSKAIFASSYNDHYIIISHNCEARFRNLPSCQVHVHKRSSDGHFELDHIINQNQVTDLNLFTVDSQLYLSVSSSSTDLTLFKLVETEGFQEIASFAILVKSTMYLRDDDDHYLTGVGEENGIYLLSLQFSGESGEQN